jgi:hypothetical protein
MPAVSASRAGIEAAHPQESQFNFTGFDSSVKECFAAGTRPVVGPRRRSTRWWILCRHDAAAIAKSRHGQQQQEADAS